MDPYLAKSEYFVFVYDAYIIKKSSKKLVSTFYLVNICLFIFYLITLTNFYLIKAINFYFIEATNFYLLEHNQK